MSVSFGLKASTPRKKPAAPLAAFNGAEDNEVEAVLTEAEKLAQSEQLQVRSFPSVLRCTRVVLTVCAQHQLDQLVSGDRSRAMLLLMQRCIRLHCKPGIKLSG